MAGEDKGKIRCKSCEALNDASRSTCEKCKAFLPFQDMKGIRLPKLNVFLSVKFGKKGKSYLRLYDLREGKVLTGKVTVKDIQGLRTSLNAKPIRDVLKKGKKLEQIISDIQDHPDEWGREKREAIEPAGLQKRVVQDLGVLHPAGGLTETFVYEPIGFNEFLYRTSDGKKGIVQVQVEYEEPEKKSNPTWLIVVEGNPYYFTKKPPKEWLFNMPNRETVEKWVNGETQSLATEKLWNLNGVYLRTFLDFPHEYEFSATLLYVQQTWLIEILPVVFYLGIKGEFGGGKTVTGEAITFVCRHGYLTGNLSPPFVARAIQDQKITLMVDELDSIAGTKDSDLNSIFRQGYRRGLKYSRVNPDTLESESYLIFSSKLFTVHSEIEEALQTRTVPIHVRETDKPEYPIVNLDKESFSRMVYTENFLWYMDHILAFRDNEMHVLNGLTSTSVDIVDMVDLKISESKVKEHATKIREKIYSKKKAFISEGQLSQLCQLTGRNIELMYMCFVLSNIIKVKCDNDIKKTFDQKIIEEGERAELGYLGVLREVLTNLWKEKQGKKEYTTEDGFTKISNKEIYNQFNQHLKKEYDAGVSPAKFKEFMLVFGFTDALNRTKLKVPIPDDLEPKSRLCNIFTSRVLRKLEIEKAEEPTEVERHEEVRKWIFKHRKDGTVNAPKLAGFIKAKGLEPQKVVEKFRGEGILFEVPALAKWGVATPTGGKPKR